MHKVLVLVAVALLSSIGHCTTQSDEDEDGDYFGVPLGALHFSADGTSAEVYAADEFTIIFNHFHINPRQSGCIAMMIGPPRQEDVDNVVEGHGLLIAPAHPPVRASKARLRRRRRRQAPTPLASRSQQFQNWPIEFDHLLMEPPRAIFNEGGISGGKAVQQLPLAAVHVPTPVEQPSKAGDNPSRKLIIRTLESIVNEGEEEDGEEVEEKSKDAFETAKPAPTTESAAAANVSSLPIVISSSGSVPTMAAVTEMPTSTSTTKYTPPPQPSTPPPPPTSTATTATTAEQPLILFESHSPHNYPAQARSSPPLPTSPLANAKGPSDSLGVVVTGTGETYAINSHNLEANFARFLQDSARRQVPSKASPDLIRRAPSRNNFDGADLSNNGQAESTSPGGKSLNGFGQQPNKQHLLSSTAQPPSHPSSINTTPLFWVIKDPRESRRQRLIELRKKVEPAESAAASISSTTPTPRLPSSPSDRFDPKFELPRIRDKLATFSLTNGAKITQYKWIGLYDQCLKRHIPLVMLRDVDPPREEKIAPLSGWSNNASSQRIHILNCNTILIPGFFYNSEGASKNTYFFVGVGDFPAVERQVKATVVGSRRDDPLKTYQGEDVLLRLPKGYRTFDIDFISIYNTDQQKSFGHVIIPSLLVPPCADE